MASSSSRKSNSSASNQKPTFRRSTGAKPAAAPAPRAASASTPMRAAVPSTSRVRSYTAPTKKAASMRASSAKSAKSTSRSVKRTTASTATRAVGKPRVTPTARKASSVSTKQVAKQVRSQTSAAKPTRSARKLPSIGRTKASAPSRKASSGAFHLALPKRLKSDAQPPETSPRPQAPSRIRATASLRERIQAFGIVRLILISMISVAVLVGISVVVVVNSSLFAVVDVVVEGSDHIPQQTAEQLVDLPEGATLLNVDEDQVASRLLENPWVESVSIEREFPHTITVKPVERDVAAIAYIVADDVAWAIGDDDAWIAPLSVAVQQDSAADDETDATDGDGTSDEDALDGDSVDEENTDGEDDGTDEDGDGAEGDAQDTATSSGLEAAYQVALDNDAVLLTDVNADVSPSAGKPVDDEVIRAGLEYIHGFTPEFLAMIKDLSLPSVEAISANLTSGVEVSLGEPEDIQQKEQVIRRLIEQESGVTYINVRVADAYSFRSADIS